MSIIRLLKLVILMVRLVMLDDRLLVVRLVMLVLLVMRLAMLVVRLVMLDDPLLVVRLVLRLCSGRSPIVDHQLNTFSSHPLLLLCRPLFHLLYLVQLCGLGKSSKRFDIRWFGMVEW